MQFFGTSLLLEHCTEADAEAVLLGRSGPQGYSGIKLGRRIQWDKVDYSSVCHTDLEDKLSSRIQFNQSHTLSFLGVFGAKPPSVMIF